MKESIERQLAKTAELLFHAKEFLKQAQENLSELRKEILASDKNESKEKAKAKTPITRQRDSRMMEILTFINSMEPSGATMTTIEGHMLRLFGLKFKTTNKMVEELTDVLIEVDGHGFYHLTREQQAAFKRMTKDKNESKEA